MNCQVEHPPLIKRVQKALGGAFGPRNRSLFRLWQCFMMFLLMLNREFCLELVTLYWIFQEHSPAINSVEVLGVVRGSEKPSIFVPANDPGTSQWFYIDVPAIARTCGLPENTLYIEDINDNVNPSNPYPVPKDANTLIRSSVMPQDHLNYTLTWYSHFLTFINLWI